MTALYLLSSAFMTMILLAVLFFSVEIIRKVRANKVEMQELKTKVEETQKIFKEDISNILSRLKNIFTEVK